MRPLKIALLQIAPEGNLSGNLEKGVRACREAAALGADIALFPEMWSLSLIHISSCASFRANPAR